MDFRRQAGECRAGGSEEAGCNGGAVGAGCPVPAVGVAVTAACLLEVLARKAGNVYPGRSFADASAMDFLLSAAAIGPVLEQSASLGIGGAVLAAVRATRGVTTANTNLGIVLLLAPLAAVAVDSHATIAERLAGMHAAMRNLSTTREDAEAVYEAIRLARPGGLGEVATEDIRRPPTVTLLEAMKLAAERDLVARQYAHGYAEVFTCAVPWLAEFPEGPLELAILTVQLRLLADVGDTLISRKLGPAVEAEVRRRAERVLRSGWPEAKEAVRLYRELDDWLRADGNARNPGAVADLLTAALFVALRTGSIRLPLCIPWHWQLLDGRDGNDGGTL